jgi:CubicO group peptidase (beta-lactamase class C family)
MDRWLTGALDYVARWLEFQMRTSEQPGCVVAIALDGKVIFEQALGYANLERRVRLTPRHRFRIASHSKSFTAAGVMKLRERGKLKLDDAIGEYVGDLHPKIAAATISQVLSHTAGIVRDGRDSGQFLDRRKFLDARELRADLRAAPIIEANARFKYSNHGFGLIGLAIEAITGEPYVRWIAREIVQAGGLKDTVPDMPLPRGTPFALGHSGKLPLGRRIIIPGDNPTRAIAPAGGFVSTARDVARFFNRLSPGARNSVISAASRREMIRRQWRDPHATLERYYGLGIISGTLDGWEWFGHSGSLQGYITRTATVPERRLTVSVLTNAVDGWAHPWVDGVLHILSVFAKNGPPARGVAGWSGRWWSLWGAADLVPVGNKVLVAAPVMWRPFDAATELKVTGRDKASIAVAGGYASHGEEVRRIRGKSGKATAIWLGGAEDRPESAIVREMEARYGRRKGGARSRSRRASSRGRL